MPDKFMGKLPEIHCTAYVAPSADVIGMVVLKEDSSVWHNAVLRGDIDKIVVGKGANIQDGCVIHCSENMGTFIGDGTTVGHNAVLHSCVVGGNSLIGMGAILLDGSKVGDDCLIAAGSLLTPGTVIPDGTMAMGSPAKVKRELTEQEKEGIRENAIEYIRLKDIYRGGR
ncbi:MAG: gamma carbonic anhydrase family protein [Clostridia bacterium]|nr:gamma carbonic anhydrase family protein [Clostridia bacterium]